jgi:hypothetical protein
MKSRFYITVGIILSIIHSARSQEVIAYRVADDLFGVAWDINIPVNNKFVTRTSLDGFRFEYRKLIKHRMSVGLEVSWNSYYQYVPRETHQTANGAVTTDFYKYIYTLPLAMNIHYYLYRSKYAVIYGGMALGASYSEQQLYYNTYASADYNWGFLARPEAGVIIRPSESSGFGFLVATRYSYSTNKQSNVEINGLQSLGFQVGIVGFY